MNNLSVNGIPKDRIMGNNLTKNNSFFTQIGLFSLIIVLIIIVTTIAILAYEKANDNQSLVDLNNLRELTLSTLNVENNSTLKTLTLSGDITASENVNITKNLTVDGTATFENISGLSVSSTSDLYGDVHALKGVSVDGGLSVGTTSNFYGDIITHGGVSIQGGLSAGGTAIIDKAKIKKDNVIKASSLNGISIGYHLEEDDTGNTYIIENQNSEGASSGHTFILPPLNSTNQNGSKFNFLWTDNLSAKTKGFTLNSGLSDSFIYGTVLAASGDDDVGVSTFISRKNRPNVYGGTSFRVFHYDGELYPGSRLECNYMDKNWFLNGTLGMSALDINVNNGFIDPAKPGWIIYGVSSEDTVLSSIFSFSGDHFFNVKAHFPDPYDYIYDSAFGISGDGTFLQVAVGDSFSPLYSSDSVTWKSGSSTFNDFIGYGVAFGTSEGVSRWVAVGLQNIIYSNNGIDWAHSTGASFPTSVGYAVAYGLSSNGTSIWVAGNDNGDLVYSVDGISWQNTTGDSFTANSNVNAIAYGLSSDRNGIWVAGGLSDNGISGALFYSENGVCWAQTTGANLSDGIRDIAFGLSDNGTSIWAAVGHDTSNSSIIFSNDGVSWEFASGTDTIANVRLTNIAFGSDDPGNAKIWIAGGNNNNPNLIYTSNNGNNGWRILDTGEANRSIEALLYSAPLYPNAENIITELS